MNQDLIKKVIKEATLLKKHTTNEEKDRLYMYKDDINPESKFNCIYGILSSDCFNSRALELLNLCTNPLTPYLDIISSDPDIKPKTFGIESYKRWFSPIEYIIFNNINTIEPIVDFICDKTKKLKLN